MARIPQFTQNFSGVPATPTSVNTNPAAAGQVSRAFGNIAKVAQNFGQDLMEKRKAAEDANYAFKRASQDMMDIEAFSEELQLKMPRDYKGYADEVEKFIQEKFEASQKEAVSETARQLYARKVGDHFSGAIIKARGTERVQRAESYIYDFEEESRKAANFQLSNPNVSLAQFQIESLIEGINEQKGVSLTDMQATALKRKEVGNVQYNLFEGLYLDEQYATGLNLLMGSAEGEGKATATGKKEKVTLEAALSIGWIDTDQYEKLKAQGKTHFVGTRDPKISGAGMKINAAILTSELSPAQKEELIRKFSKAAEEKKSFQFSQIIDRANDTIVALRAGREPDRALVSEVLGAIRSKTYDKAQTEKLIRTYADFLIAEGTGHVRRQFVNAPRSEWDQIELENEKYNQRQLDAIAKDHPDIAALKFKEAFMAATKDAAQRRFVDAAKQGIISAQNENPVQYVIENVPGMTKKQGFILSGDPRVTQQYLAEIIQHQKRLEIPESAQRLTTPGERAALGELINAGTARQTAERISQLQDQFGKHFPRIMNELVAAKKIDPALLMTTHVEGLDDRERIASNVKNGKEIKKAFSDADLDGKALTSEINAVMNDYRSALIRSGADGENVRQFNAIYDQVEIEAKKIMIDRGDISPAEAAQEAVSILTNTLPPLTSGNSTIILPRRLNGQIVNRTTVDAYIRSHTTAKAFEQMGVEIPQGMEKETFYEHLENFGRWELVDNNTAIKLVIDHPQSRRIEVIDKNGKPIKRSLLDITYEMDDLTKEQIEDDNKFLGIF